MKKYYMNPNNQNNGDYEVHVEGCKYLAMIQKPIYLGEFSNCSEAVQVANQLYSTEVTRLGGQINGCYYCCNTCHTQ